VRGRRRDGITLDMMRAGPVRRRTSPDPLSYFAGGSRSKIQPHCASRKQRREAPQSAVKLIRHHVGAGAARWASEIIEVAP
jgi:hypothetical protein